MIIFAKQMIDLREKKNWRPSELAQRLLGNKCIMSRIESGERKLSAEELDQLSKLFGVSPDYLLNGKKFALPQEKIATYDTEKKSELSNRIAEQLAPDSAKEDIEDTLRYTKYRSNTPLK